MRMKDCSRALLTVLAGGWICSIHTAVAQEILWQAPIYAEVASAVDSGGQVLSRSADGKTRLIAAAAWRGLSAEGTEIVRARVVAYDPANGQRQWQRDLDGDCAANLFDADPSLAVFPNGDVVVAAAQRPDWLRVASCYVRLDASDGHVVWSAADAGPASEELATWTSALAVDARGDVLATGSRDDAARTIKLSGTDGSLSWESRSARPGWSLRGKAVSTGTGDLVLVLNRASSNNGYESRVDAFDSATGLLRWQSAMCDTVRIAPRMQSNGDVAFVSACSRGKVTIGRLAGRDGSVTWQREIEAKELSAEFDDSGDIVLVGTLRVDAMAAEVARFSIVDGHTLWATPGALGHTPTTSDDQDVLLHVAVGGGRVFVWEMIGLAALQLVTQTGRLSLYDAATGKLLRRRDFTAADADYLLKYSASIVPLPEGEALLGDLTNHRQLWLGRVTSSLNVAWHVREPVAALQPVWMSPAEDPRFAQLLVTEHGTPGVIIGGRAITDRDEPYARPGFPYLAKVEQASGRVAWHWRPQSPAESHSPAFDGIATDASGALYAIGYAADARFETAPFVARIDQESGRSVWERFGDRLPGDKNNEASRALALAGDGSVFVASTLAVRRYAVADGALLWTAPLSDATDTEGYYDARIAVDAAGDVIVTVSYHVYGMNGEVGVDFFKLRGADGLQVWRRRVPVGPPFVSDVRLALLPRGDVVALGAGLLLSLAGENGDVRWQQPDVSASDLLVDRGGHLVLFGLPTEQNRRHGIARIDASSGAILWSRRLPVGNTHYDDEDSRRTAAALDADGGLLFAHRDDGGRYLFAKLALDDGSVIWSERMALDASGNPEGLVRSRAGRLFLAAQKSVPYNSTAAVYGIVPPGGNAPAPPSRRHSSRPLPAPLRGTPPRPPALSR